MKKHTTILHEILLCLLVSRLSVVAAHTLLEVQVHHLDEISLAVFHFAVANTFRYSFFCIQDNHVAALQALWAVRC